jgi:hypothetical protein
MVGSSTQSGPSYVLLGAISGVPIARTTVQTIPKPELESEDIMNMLAIYDKEISEKLTVRNEANDFKLYREDEDPEEIDEEQEPVDPNAMAIVIDEIENDAYDELLLVEPMLQRDNQLVRARIIGIKCDENGNPIGHFDKNPVLNSRIYLAEFPDGHVQELSANTIVEAIYNNIDDEGHTEQMFHDIIGHRFDSTALTKEELQNIQKARQEGNRSDCKRICTLKGWEICISWQDASTSWHSLSDIKN